MSVSPKSDQHPQQQHTQNGHNTTATREAVAAGVERTLRLVVTPGDLVEIRAPRTPGQGTVSGYYSDITKCARDVAAQLDGKAPGVYLTLNPIQPDVSARASNRLKPYADFTTQDSEITRRRWLPIDSDPVRPTGVSATDAEHALALERAESVAGLLTDAFGWPEPICADSGNGAHLLYRVDLPNDGEARALVARVLTALASVFDDDAVKIDSSVANAARIWKLYPTWARKGDSTPERPHRRSRLLRAPDDPQVVTREQLEAVCSDLCGDDEATASHNGASGAHGKGWIDDMGAYLAEHGIEVLREHSDSRMCKWVLRTCVWNSEHTDHSAYVLQFNNNGVIVAGCSHHSCRGKHFVPDFRDAVEPGWRATTSAESLGDLLASSATSGVVNGVHERSIPLLGADGSIAGGAAAGAEAAADQSTLTRRANGNAPFPLLKLDDLARVGQVKPEVLLPGKIMRRSLNLTYGDGETGKSYFAQDAAFTLAAAGVPVWYVAAEGFDGIYLRILAWLGTHQRGTASLAALRVIPLPVQIFRGGDAHILAAQARDLPPEECPQLIVLDTIHRCTTGARESDNGDMGCVATTAALWRSDFGATTWGIHHEGKSAGQGMRGASCLYDDADSVQYVFRGGDISVIECEKQKDAIPRFEPEAFTLHTVPLDGQGYPGLTAKVVTSLGSDQIVEARRMWAAEQQRKQPGAKNAVAGDDPDALSGTLGKALTIFSELYRDHPDGVFKSTWRAACEAQDIKAGSFDWISKELQRRGKLHIPDTTGRYVPLGK